MKKNKSFIWAGSVLAAFVLFSSFRPFADQKLSAPDSAQLFSKSAKGLHISARVYNSDECKQYLHYDYIGRGVVPVEVHIRNSSANSYDISAASVSMPTLSGKELAWKETKKALPRSLALRIAGLFFWPLAIPATIDSIVVYKSHRMLSKDLEAKTLKRKDERILPYSTTSRVLYVKEEGYTEGFSFSLQDVDSKELIVIPTGSN